MLLFISVTGISVEEALRVWQERNLLSSEQIARLRNALQEGSGAPHRSPKAIIIFGTLGAVLIGLGIILFVASNWEDMRPFMRIATVFLGYAIIVGAAFTVERKGYTMTAESLWFLASLSLGAAIFLIGQVFNYSLTYWQAPLLWMIGALAMGYARQKGAHGVIAVPLGILAIGWFGTEAGSGVFEQFSFMWSDDGLRPLFPLLGVGLVSLSLLLRRVKDWQFIELSCMSWGLLFASVPLIVTTAEQSIMQDFFTAKFTAVQLSVMVVSAALVLAVVAFGHVRAPQTKGALLGMVVFLFSLLLQRGSTSLLGSLTAGSMLGFILYIVVIALIALGAIWLGMVTANPKLVNYGIVSASIIIFIQYVSWSFSLLNRSLAFIGGGILLVALSIFIEKKRRDILARMRT